AGQLEPRRDERLPDEPVGEERDLFFYVFRRRVSEGVDRVPAAELDAAELRMVVGVPIDVTLAPESLVVPSEHLQIVLRRVVPMPVDKLIGAGLCIRPESLG